MRIGSIGWIPVLAETPTYGEVAPKGDVYSEPSADLFTLSRRLSPVVKACHHSERCTCPAWSHRAHHRPITPDSIVLCCKLANLCQPKQLIR